MPAALFEVFMIFLRLGSTCFGGPAAHVGFFHEEFVVRRRWLDEAEYADLVALCQFLPGPSSSQIGMALGLRRAGAGGLCAAWLGFTLPSAALMIAFAYGLETMGGLGRAGWTHGLKLAAVAVVAQAVWTMGNRLCPDRASRTLAFAAAAAVLGWPRSFVPGVVIAVGALAGLSVLRGLDETPPAKPDTGSSHLPAQRAPGIASLACLAAFFALLLGLPALSAALPGVPALRLASSFFRVGTLVFGGGHVVLPLLQSETVARGWLTSDRFLAGYGAAQALPGPLFAFAGFLGASLRPPFTGGWADGVRAIVSIFLPSMLLLPGVLPLWETMRRLPGARRALRGANAAVVGVLLAACYNPVWTGAVHDARDFTLALGAFGLLMFWRCPPWLVVILAALAGGLLL